MRLTETFLSGENTTPRNDSTGCGGPVFDGFMPLAAIGPDDFRRATEGLPPYSSFNHVSVYCLWPEAQAAVLDNGIALVLDDPLTGQRYVTALSDGADDTILRDLLRYAHSLGVELRLVPEHTLSRLPVEFQTDARPDGFDYIVDVAAMLNPETPGLARRHRRAQAFQTSHPDVVVDRIELSGEAVSAMLGIDRVWREARDEDPTARWEACGQQRCLDHRDVFNLTTAAAFDGDGQMLGWTVNEILGDGYYMAHYGKTLPSHAGLSELLELETARFMQAAGCHRMNFQEDHGNPGLRRMKQSWGPCDFLRVYDVRDK